MSEKEEIYDKEIAPLLLQAAKLCETHGIALVAHVEFEPDKFGLTASPTVNFSLSTLMVLWAAQSKANLDLFMIKVRRWNNGRPHNSMVLRILEGEV